MTIPEPTVDPSWGDAPDLNEHAKFKNIYEITLNSTTVGYCLYTSLNDVVFLSNFNLTNYTALDSFGTLPSDCTPITDIFMPIIVNDGTNIISSTISAVQTKEVKPVIVSAISV